MLEECARAATQPQLLKILLQHQMCLGHLEAAGANESLLSSVLIRPFWCPHRMQEVLGNSILFISLLFAASLPPNMGDSILDSLSLPPSGRAASREPTGAKKADAGSLDDTRTQTETPFITPVIGVISNEDMPVMLRDGGGAGVDAGKAGGEPPKARKAAKPSSGIKRKQPDRSESGEEVEVDSQGRSEEQGTGRSLGSCASVLTLDREGEKGPNVLRTEDSKSDDLGIQPPHENLSLHFVTCLNREPMILLARLPASYESMSESSRASKSPRAQWPPQRRRKPSSKPDSAFPASDNKE